MGRFDLGEQEDLAGGSAPGTAAAQGVSAVSLFVMVRMISGFSVVSLIHPL